MSAFGPSYPGEAAGGGGTTTDFAALSLGDPIDLTDGSWTLLDHTSALVKSVSFSGGYNTVTFNATTGDNDFVLQSNHTDFKAPRWYRAWNVGSTRMNSVSLSTWRAILDADDTIFDFKNQIGVGVVAAPTTLVRADLGVAAGLFTQDGATSLRYGAWMGAVSATPGANSSFARGSFVGHYGGDHNGNTEFIALNSSNERVQNGARAGNVSLSNVDLFEIVSVGIHNASTNISDNDTVRFRAYFTGVRFTLP